MCGITAIVNKKRISAHNLMQANQIVRHRGPDDEGYLLWDSGQKLDSLVGPESALSTRKEKSVYSLIDPSQSFKAGLGHRRLSILDLSPAGHQPMLLEEAGLVITYNGEVYNYLELREELKQLGHRFMTGSDTEVILHAWAAWGPNCLHRFNGMFAFVILDSRRHKLYVVRDRFGIKPLYYTECIGYLAFASEVKQLRLLPEYEFQLNEANAYDYLRYGSVDHNTETFERGIQQVGHGHYIEVDLRSCQYQAKQWYNLKPTPWKGNFKDARQQFYELLKDSVRLRMRSDVPVGSALSGGLDSSTIVCLMREVIEDQGKSGHLIKTITACQEDKRYDEWDFAKVVIEKVNAKPYRVFPSFEKLLEDLDRFMWHMDYPFGSTSQFSQWCVFEGAAQAGLKVMVDGQGADEQLAGYGGNDMALYTGLLGSGRLKKFLREVKAYRRYRGHWPTGFVIGAFQHHLPAQLLNQIPDRFRVRKQYAPEWLKLPANGNSQGWAGSLQESLYRQVTNSPLPSLLRYEDRNSMAFSIESRVPFMDYRLIEFSLGLPEDYVYCHGERKRILREAFQDLIPNKVATRKDKMGFVSAEESWLRKEGTKWFEENIDLAAIEFPDLFDKKEANNFLSSMVKGKIPFSSTPWNILCLRRFLNQINK